MLVGRQGKRRQLATVVMFFAPEASSYITGTVLPVDGGFTITCADP
jgi:2-deoxy-D-gluconate 3-dehydrogenase